MSSSFTVLIPKKECAVSVEDYRPISLIGCLYKIICKMFANRPKTVISDVIGPKQSAFLSGRNILDNVLVANEIIHSLVKSRNGGVFSNWTFIRHLIL